MVERKVLVVDDDESIRWVLRKALEKEGHTVNEAKDGEEALRAFDKDPPFDLALVDIRMPRIDGLDLLSRIRERSPSLAVIIMTAQDTMKSAIEAMKRGAFDYIKKPFDLDELALIVRRALEVSDLNRGIRELKKEVRKKVELGANIVGSSSSMREIFKLIGRVSQSDATILIQGESGTGKELIARTIHSHSSRWSKPFVALNCAAIPRELLESELFGHEKGAFTGAYEKCIGEFEVAQGGTLFLDEVGDIPVDVQTKLLRVLQEKEFSRVGSREMIRADVRIIAATNKILDKLVRGEQFREDLYFRLKVIPISVPPLRERRDDIAELTDYFLEKVNREMGTRIEGISEDARRLLEQHSWPGNVRELENVLTRGALLASGPTLLPRDIQISLPVPEAAYQDLSLEELVRLKLQEFFDYSGDVDPRNLYELLLQRVEKPLIELTLRRTRGNQLRAADILGINRNTLHKKIANLKINVKALLQS
jgi:two-component system nitrogen regulation response regulator GlnG